MVKKEAVKKFSCLKCGSPFDAYPPDDRHNVATRNEKDFKDNIKVDYVCKDCRNTNTIYWGHPEPAIAIGHF
jgi:rubredoxin